jgi:hypothetical protein
MNYIISVPFVVINCDDNNVLFRSVYVGFNLSWATKALREGRGIALLYF